MLDDFIHEPRVAYFTMEIALRTAAGLAAVLLVCLLYVALIGIAIDASDKRADLADKFSASPRAITNGHCAAWSFTSGTMRYASCTPPDFHQLCLIAKHHG